MGTSAPVRTRAKFRVQQVIDSNYGGIEQIASQAITLTPVYDPDPNSENHAFWTATPAGQLQMWVNNPQIFGMFEQGQEYYLDFTPAPTTTPVS